MEVSVSMKQKNVKNLVLYRDSKFSVTATYSNFYELLLMGMKPRMAKN